MFRVSKAEKRSQIIVTVEGQLSVHYIEVLEECCRQAISTGKPVHLFLRDVTTVDQAGRALLRRLAAKGVRLRGFGVYTSYLVEVLSPWGAEPLNFTLDAGTAGGDRTGRKP